MTTIIRKRTIRPSHRQKQSRSYRVVTEGILPIDTLEVNIYHETKPQQKVFIFYGKTLLGKRSINFQVNELTNDYEIKWYGNVVPDKSLLKR